MYRDIDTNSKAFIRDSRRAFGLPDLPEPEPRLAPERIAALLDAHHKAEKLRLSDQARTGKRYPAYPNELDEVALLRLGDEIDVKAIATQYSRPLQLDGDAKQARDGILNAYHANKRAAVEAAIAERQARDDELYEGTGVTTGRLSADFLNSGD